MKRTLFIVHMATQTGQWHLLFHKPLRSLSLLNASSVTFRQKMVYYTEFCEQTIFLVTYYHKIVVQETPLSWKRFTEFCEQTSFLSHIVTKLLFKKHHFLEKIYWILWTKDLSCRILSQNPCSKITQRKTVRHIIFFLLQPPPIGDNFVWGNGLIVRRNLRQKMFHITTESKAWQPLQITPDQQHAMR